MAAQKEEEDRKANHAEIVAAKKEDIATLTATIETKLARQGDLEVEVESLKNDVADMQRSLAADQELTAKLAESGSGQSSEWEERQESRAGEGAPCESRTSRKTVTCHISLSLCADGARQVRFVCAKPQTSREVDQDPKGGLTRQCNTRLSFLIVCCV